MGTLFVILLVIFVVSGIAFAFEIKNAPYWDEEHGSYSKEELDEQEKWIEDWMDRENKKVKEEYEEHQKTKK